jgi:serine/threonine-protein kinase
MPQYKRAFELVAPAGVGGMATVWRGRMYGEHGFSRTIAVKRLLPAVAEDEPAVAMFAEEARIVSELRHPNIVEVYDFCRDDLDRYLILMEWVDGVDVRRWVHAHARAGTRTPWTIATFIATEILRGLGAAHDRTDAAGRPAPVYHRDVTPSNVMLGIQGVVKLTDFGMARAADRATITQPGVLKGKMAYMAPEYLGGGQASERTDLWGVGALLWEMLAGRRLRTENDPAKLFGLASTAATPILDLRDDVPGTLADVLACALEVDPRMRYGTAREMRRALLEVLHEHGEVVDEDDLAASVREIMSHRDETAAPISERPPSVESQPTPTPT